MTLYAKATMTGVIAALMASIVLVGGTVVFGGVAATGGGGIAGVSIGLAEAALSMVFALAVIGFVAGFTWTVRRERRRTNRLNSN